MPPVLDEGLLPGESGPSAVPCLQLLLAPAGELSGDGQLRELMREQRRHSVDGSGGIWYLPAHHCRHLLRRQGVEGVVLLERGTAVWLQLRFGGTLQPVHLPAAWLSERALALAPAAPPALLGPPV